MRQIYCVFSDAGKSVKVFFFTNVSTIHAPSCTLFVRDPVHYSCATLYIICAPLCTLSVRHKVHYSCATLYIIRALPCTLFVHHSVHYPLTQAYLKQHYKGTD